MKIKILLLVTVLLLAACNRSEPPLVINAKPVKIFTVEDSSRQGERFFPARLQAGDETALSFQRGGYLEQLLIRQGEQVKKGQLLAQLDDTDMALRVRDREATFGLTRAQYQRLAALGKRHFVSQADLDVAKANLDSARAALQIAREEQGFMRLTAPFDGVISTVDVNNHEVVTPARTIATLSSLDTFDVIFSVPESLFHVFDVKNKDYQAAVTLNHVDGREFIAQYKEHSATTVDGSLTYRVIFSMKRPPDLPLLSGMSGRVRVQFGHLSGVQMTSIVVPIEAVFNPDHTHQGQPFVWVVEEDENQQLRVKERKVQLGQLAADGIEITSGLKDGEHIVAVGSSELRAHEVVRAWVRERGL